MSSKESVITNENDLSLIQDELINRGGGAYLKKEKPQDKSEYTKRKLTRNLAICLIFVTSITDTQKTH